MRALGPALSECLIHHWLINVVDALQQEQMEFAHDQIRGLEERNKAMKATVDEIQSEADEKVRIWLAL